MLVEEIGYPMPLHLPLPPSWNDGKRYSKVSDLREACEAALGQLKLKPQKYVMVLKFVCKWTSGNNKPLRKDVSNRVKQVEDAVMSTLDLDDKWVWYSVAAKQDSQTHSPHVLVSVFPVGTSGPFDVLQRLSALL